MGFNSDAENPPNSGAPLHFGQGGIRGEGDAWALVYSIDHPPLDFARERVTTWGGGLGFKHADSSSTNESLLGYSLCGRSSFGPQLPTESQYQ
jgi:hypothetical protein